MFKKTISICQVYLFGECQRVWETGSKILCNLSIRSPAHSCSPGLLGSHFAASVCECDLACFFWAAPWLSGQYFPGQPARTCDSNPYQRDHTWDVWVPSQCFHFPVSSSLLCGSVGSVDEGSFLFWKGERGDWFSWIANQSDAYWE